MTLSSRLRWSGVISLQVRSSSPPKLFPDGPAPFDAGNSRKHVLDAVELPPAACTLLARVISARAPAAAGATAAR